MHFNGKFTELVQSTEETKLRALSCGSTQTSVVGGRGMYVVGWKTADNIFKYFQKKCSCFNKL